MRLSAIRMLASLVLVITAVICLELLDQLLLVAGAALSPASVDGTVVASMESWASASAAEELTSLIIDPCLHDVRSPHRSFSSQRPLVSQSSWLSSAPRSDQTPSESHCRALPWRPWRAHRLRSPSEERASPRRMMWGDQDIDRIGRVVRLM